MSADSRQRRTAMLVLAWAIAEIALAVVALVVAAPRALPRRAAPRATTRPAATAPTPAARSQSSPGATPAVPAQAGAARVGSTPEAEPAPAGSEASSTTAPPAADTLSTAEVSCLPDLTLAASPDAPYSFLCTRGTTPISWPTDSIRLYATGLTPAQTVALPAALEQWQARARFTVTRVNTEAAADVVVKGTPLANNEDGYTAMHYACAAVCAYDHADVQLASNVALASTSWISTILHELGHVAGLNHVSRHSEVMYPEIDARSPVLFGSGDLAGFQALERVRSGG